VIYPRFLAQTLPAALTLAPLTPVSGSLPHLLLQMLTVTECTDVSFNGNTCYLKSTVSLPVYNGGVLGAIRVGTYDASATQITATPTGAPTPAQTVTTTTTIYGSPYACQCTPAPTSLVGGSGPGSLGSGSSGVNCPSADGTTFTGSCGSQYTIECGIDRNNNDSKSYLLQHITFLSDLMCSSWLRLCRYVQRLHEPMRQEERLC